MDIVFIPITVVLAYLFRFWRKHSLKNFPYTKKLLLAIGVYPIIDHYYEPLFHRKYLRSSLRSDRMLPGIDYNDNEQLMILSRFHYNDELQAFPINKTTRENEYYYNNSAFLSGDSEYLYNMIRLFKPKKIIEVGSGFSTLMALNAIEKNSLESPEYHCDLICIEPYEHPWLEEIDAQVVRKKVETIERSYFSSLQKNDFLFIDSSHIIRPQGDVVFQCLEILPSLSAGVIVHFHDIFTPKDYLDEWFGEYLWNEQYLLEAFLSLNKEFRIIGATNYLSHKYHDEFADKCPIYKNQDGREPGSFWIVRN